MKIRNRAKERKQRQDKCARTDGGHDYSFESQVQYYNKRGKGMVKSKFKCSKCGKTKLMTDAQMYAASKLAQRNQAKARLRAKNAAVSSPVED